MSHFRFLVALLATCALAQTTRPPTAPPPIIGKSWVFVTGTIPVSGHCAQFSGASSVSDAGAACGGGGVADPGSNGILKRISLNTTAVATLSDFTALGLVASSSLATVATSGSYPDLLNKPTTWPWASLSGVPSLVNSLNSQTGAISLGIGTSGTSPGWSASTLNIPLASAAGVTAGLLSNADYTSFSGKQGALGFTPENIANKDANSGYVGRDSGGGLTIPGTATAANFASTDTTHSGSSYFGGVTSGGVGIAAADVAGTAITYILPFTNGTAGQYLQDLGATTCPTLIAGMPSPCHQWGWGTPSGGGGLGDPGSNGLVKRTALNTTTAAVAGTDYQAPLTAYSAISGLTGYPLTWPPPNPSASTLGGVESIDCTGTGHILGISTSGVPTCSADSGGGGGTPVGTATASLTFTAVPDLGCKDQTFAFTGITTATQLSPGWPSTLPAGVVGAMWSSAASTATVRLCNASGAVVTFGPLTYTAKIANYYLTASATPTFTAVPDGACQSQNMTLTGASAGDPVVAGAPSTFAAGLNLGMVATATNTVGVRVCNWSGSSVTPSGTFTATIAK